MPTVSGHAAGAARSRNSPRRPAACPHGAAPSLTGPGDRAGKAPELRQALGGAQLSAGRGPNRATSSRRPGHVVDYVAAGTASLRVHGKGGRACQSAMPDGDTWRSTSTNWSLPTCAPERRVMGRPRRTRAAFVLQGRKRPSGTGKSPVQPARRGHKLRPWTAPAGAGAAFSAIPAGPGPRLGQELALRDDDVPAVVLDEVQRLVDGLEHVRDRVCSAAPGPPGPHAAWAALGGAGARRGTAAARRAAARADGPTGRQGESTMREHKHAAAQRQQRCGRISREGSLKSNRTPGRKRCTATRGACRWWRAL